MNMTQTTKVNFRCLALFKFYQNYHYQNIILSSRWRGEVQLGWVIRDRGFRDSRALIG